MNTSDLKDSWVIAITVMVTVGILGFNINSFYSHKIDKTVELARIEAERENNKLNVKLNIDKLTYCMQTIMESSLKSGKPIDANKAKEICQSGENIEK